MFHGILKMNEACPVCGMKFEREEGYYTGAMFINWLIIVFLIGPVWVTMFFTGVGFWTTFTVTAILLIVLTPFIIQYSRAIWLYLDFYVFHSE